MTRTRILAYAQDAGGAQAVLPVIRRLLADPSLSVHTVVHGPAVRLVSGSGIPAFPLESFGYPVPLAPDAADGLLRRLSPDLFFSATSHPRDPSNGRLIAAARLAGIPTVAILDHWKGLERFRERAGGPMSFVPDWLGVMDQPTRAVCVADGIPPDRVAVVGHPFLEQLDRDRPAWVEASRTAELKRRAGVDPTSSVILFASELLHDHGYHDPCRDTCLPLTQAEVGGTRLWDVVARTARDLSAESGCALEVVVRPHPNEQGAGPTGAWVVTQETLTDAESVAMASVALGVSAMPLIAAAVLGKPAGSLTCFDGWSPARVFFDRAGWEGQPFFTVLETADRLRSFLGAALEGCGIRELSPAYGKELLEGATDRCVELVKSRLGVVAK